MRSILTRLAAATLVVVVVCAALGAQNANTAHPIFTDLEVGQKVNFRWDQGGYVIANWGGIKLIEALGPDYIVISETGHTYYIYINQIKMVDIRPGPRTRSKF